MISVYICMPYGDHNTPEQRLYNAQAAMRVWHVLASAGFAPYCPHLSHYLHELKPQKRELWITHCLHWVHKCDCVLVFGEKTDGMRMEIANAWQANKPVFRTFGELGAAYGMEV